MIKTITAYTAEVDDVEAAVEEIQGQLGEGALLKNSVGIISCYADFVESGVVAALARELPFEIVGATTLASTVRGTEEEILLSLMVLTSEDVRFAAGLSGPITDAEHLGDLEGAYRLAADKLSGKPALILSYAPLLMNVGGDEFVRAMDAASGGVPNFGTLAVDHNEDYHEAYVIAGAEAYRDRYAFILIDGDVRPRFFVASISNEKVFAEKGVVTASKGNQLQTVNNMPVGDYLAGLGLQKNADGSITGINSFPFVMDLNDGAMPIVRVMFALTPEGYAVCGGEVPVGAILTVGSIDAQEVVTTTRERLAEAINGEGLNGMLIYSCVGRYFSLGYHPTDEMDAVREILKDTDIPYHFAYSGCELCPVEIEGRGETRNRSHNDTCVICVF